LIGVIVRKSAVIVLQNQAYSDTFYTQTEISASVLIENYGSGQARPERLADASLDRREADLIGNHYRDIATR